MTLLDGIVLAVVVLFLLHGLFRGLLRKLAGIGALIGACVAVGFVAAEATTYIRERWDVTAAWLHPVCAIAGWLALYILLRIILGLLARALLAALGDGVRSWDRKLGALFGAVEALVLCWFVVTILDAYPEDKRAEQAPGLHEQLGRSFFARVVHDTNPAVRLELQPLIADLTTVSEQPGALENLRDEPEVAEVAQHAKVQAILNDPALLQMFAQGKMERFFDDPKVQAAVQDPEVRSMLRRLPIRELLRKAAERAREQEPPRES